MCAYVAVIFQLARADMEGKHGVIPTAKRTISATTPMISFVFAQACRGLRHQGSSHGDTAGKAMEVEALTKTVMGRRPWGGARGRVDFVVRRIYM